MIESEIELIRLAQQGNRRAFEQIIFKYDKHVLNIAYSFRNNPDDAKDIYQEVFLRVFKGLKNFRFDSEFSTWLYRITTNICITYKNRNKKEMHDSIDTEINNGDEKYSDYMPSENKTDELLLKNETNKLIEDALNTLPAQQKMAFTMKYYNEYKIKEIAEIMSCNEGTIKRYLFNATHKLQKMLSPLMGR
jgi:RNA polymerase sigma-70 factor (ECF subfamily)